MDHLLNDLRFGARLLRKSPVFTAVGVLTVALAIGSSTTVFSVVNAIWLQPLRFPGDDRVVMVWETAPRQQLDRGETSLATFQDWREQGQAFEHLAGFTPEAVLLGSGEQAEWLPGSRVSAS